MGAKQSLYCDLEPFKDYETTGKMFTAITYFGDCDKIWAKEHTFYSLNFK